MTKAKVGDKVVILESAHDVINIPHRYIGKTVTITDIEFEDDVPYYYFVDDGLEWVLSDVCFEVAGITLQDLEKELDEVILKLQEIASKIAAYKESH